MLHYLDSSLSVEDVCEAVVAINQEYGLADSYTPYDLEDALLMWLNQISTAYHNTADPDAQDIAYIEDLWTGLCDGTCVAVSIMSYRPDLLNIDQLCIGVELSIKEMVYNWQQILDVCDREFNVLGSFNPISMAQNQDYALKTNLLTFLTELFCALVYEEEQEVHNNRESMIKSQIRAPQRDFTENDLRQSSGMSIRQSLAQDPDLIQIETGRKVKPLDSSAYFDAIRAGRVQRNLMGEIVRSNSNLLIF
jgi:hypothetical protein